MFFIGYINVKKGDFRQELLQTNKLIFEKKELLKEDLFKNKNGIVWHENNKEISMNGGFYEVVKIEEKGNLKVLYLIKDKKENDLFTSFFLNQNQNKEPLLNFVKLFLNLNYLKTTAFNFDYNPVCTWEKPSYTTVILDSQFSFKKVKPPRFLFI